MSNKRNDGAANGGGVIEDKVEPVALHPVGTPPGGGSWSWDVEKIEWVQQVKADKE